MLRGHVLRTAVRAGYGVHVDDLRAETEAIDDVARVRKAFAPARLRMARELAGETQADVAEAADVTSVAVSQYERGLAVPSEPVIRSLAAYLRVPPAFFTVTDRGADVPAFFRSLRATPAGGRKRARHFVQLVDQVVDAIEERVRLPSVDLPCLPLGDDAANDEIEDVAAKVRQAWEVPAGPIDNMVRLVERHGVIASRYESATGDIDAFSVPLPRRPIIVMSAKKGKRDRSRFDVAHELGHLIAHEPGQRATRKAEDQAHAFAAALLMPSDDIKDFLPTSFDLESLLALKREWHCSLGALLHRAKTLRVMDDHRYLSAMKLMSARGWRRHEPGDLGEPESPVLLRKAMEMADFTAETLSKKTAIPLWAVREIVSQMADDRPRVVV